MLWSLSWHWRPWKPGLELRLMHFWLSGSILYSEPLPEYHLLLIIIVFRDHFCAQKPFAEGGIETTFLTTCKAGEREWNWGKPGGPSRRLLEGTVHNVSIFVCQGFIAMATAFSKSELYFYQHFKNTISFTKSVLSQISQPVLPCFHISDIALTLVTSSETILQPVAHERLCSAVLLSSWYGNRDFEKTETLFT